MFTQKEIETYTGAQCWVLAWHIAQLIPERAKIMDFSEHVLVQIDGDKYLDINGLQTTKELCSRWKQVDKMAPISYDLSKHILPDPNNEENLLASIIAKRLIEIYLP